MNQFFYSPVFTRIAALSEIILVLALGSLIGVMIYETILPASMLDGSASPILISLYSGLRIFLRIGVTALLGFGLLYFRKGITPRQAGLTRNNKGLLELTRIGMVLGIFSATFIALLFVLHDLVPFGEGLATWRNAGDKSIDREFVVKFIATSVLIPPLMEEIMARGYNRVRLVESYGPMGGVILTGVFFAIAHARYLQVDAWLLAFMGMLIISSVSWTYLAQKTGSVIPSIIAHAMTNGIATALLFDIWIPSIIVGLLFLTFIKPIVTMIREFYKDWVYDFQRSGLWFGLTCLILMFGSGLALIPYLNKTPVLAIFGVLVFAVTMTNLVVEHKKSS